MNKSERLNQELIFLRNKSYFQLKDLMQAFGISKRTALRDVEALEELGVPLYAEHGRGGGYRRMNQPLLTPVYFDKKDIHAIFFAIQAQALLSSTPFEKSYPQIQEKLMATLSNAQQEELLKMLSVVKYHSVSPVNAPVHLTTLLQSILEEKVLKVTYTQYERVETHLQLNELFYRSGIWFFSAYDLNKKHWGTYRSDYVTSCVLQADYPGALTLKELNEHQIVYKTHYHDIPFRCRLTEFGKELFLKRHYPNMRLEVIDEIPYISGNYNEEELSYMTHYLMNFGKHVTIEYPAALKSSYLKQLEEIMESYV